MKSEIIIIKRYLILILRLLSIYSFVDRIPRLNYKIRKNFFEI